MANETDRKPQQGRRDDPEENDPQQSDIRPPDQVNRDSDKKAPGQDFERKDREGSEEIEKRRAS
ncbi:MAG TPA: hypothetical protein VFA68_03495 [Terriglobales bacterium]|nr:hypothetical protein [Terriglobales bacterium]